MFSFFSPAKSSKVIILYGNICTLVEIYFNKSVLHTFPALVPYGHDAIILKICNLLSSLLLTAILLTFSVNILSASLLNL